MEGHQPGHDRRAALNFDIGRDSNVDCLVVGSEVLITISQMKAFPPFDPRAHASFAASPRRLLEFGRCGGRRRPEAASSLPWGRVT